MGIEEELRDITSLAETSGWEERDIVEFLKVKVWREIAEGMGK